MTGELAVIELIHYIRDNRESITSNVSDKELIEQAYRDWAMYACLERLSNKPLSDACDVLEDFMLELYGYSTKCSYSKNGINPFEVAYDQIETILAMLQHPEE